MSPRSCRTVARRASLLACAAALACAEAPAEDLRPSASTGNDSAARASDAAVAASSAASPADSVPAAAPAAPASAAAPAAPAADTAALRALHSSRGSHDRTSFLSAVRAGRKAEGGWPAGPKANAGAILPGKRIIAYYGNPLSKRMGVLGEYPVDEMLTRLDREVAAWNKADPSTPVQPALHLVATVAQGQAGRDGMWRTRMDSALIEKVYGWAQRRKAILFVDIQVGHSTVAAELKPLMKFLARPDVHLGLDPEFSMHHDKAGVRPGAKIGTMTAADVNVAIRALDQLVRERKLPPKVLVVHRFTRRMVPDAEAIRPTANVQVVMDMDGWGPPWLKFDSYRDYVVAHPVQYTGFKLFYGNDTKKGDALLTPAELLALKPRPLYIQFQ